MKKLTHGGQPKTHDSDFINPYPPLKYVTYFLIVTILSIYSISITYSEIGENFNIESDIAFIVSILIGIPCFMFFNIKITWGHHSYITALKYLHGFPLILTIIAAGIEYAQTTQLSSTQHIRFISASVSIIALFILYSETYFGFVTYRKHHIRVMHRLHDGKPLEEIKIED